MNGLFSEIFISSLISGGVIAGIPLIYAGLGEAISERAGVLNVGLEGMMIGGAYGGFVGGLSFNSTWLGLICGALTGMIISLFMVVLCVRLNSNSRRYRDHTWRRRRHRVTAWCNLRRYIPSSANGATSCNPAFI